MMMVTIKFMAAQTRRQQTRLSYVQICSPQANPVSFIRGMSLPAQQALTQTVAKRKDNEAISKIANDTRNVFRLHSSDNDAKR